MEGGGRASNCDIKHYEMHISVHVKAWFGEHSVTMLGKVKLSPPEQRQKKSITSQCDNKSEDLIFKHAQCETRAERLSAQPVLKL